MYSNPFEEPLVGGPPPTIPVYDYDRHEWRDVPNPRYVTA